MEVIGLLRDYDVEGKKKLVKRRREFPPTKKGRRLNIPDKHLAG